MTISPARLRRLLEKEPALRPDGLVEIFGCETGFVKGGPKAWFPHVKFVDPAGCNISTCLGWDMFHALIRDKIVWWLATHGGDDGVFCTTNSRGFPQCATCKDGAAIEGDSDSDDPTIACVLAAERVLGLPEWKE